MATEKDFQKLAYAMGKQASMEKEAIWGKALLEGAKGAYKAFSSTGKGLLGRAGKGIISEAGKHSPGAAKWLGIAGRGVPREMMAFGTFGGGLGALMNPEDRFGGAMKGFLGGALGGAGWRGASNLAKAGQKNLFRSIAPGTAKGLYRRQGQKLFMPAKGAYAGKGALRRFKPVAGEMGWGQAAKTMGTKAALGAVPLTAAFTGAGALEGLAHGAPQPQPQQAPRPQYAPTAYTPGYGPYPRYYQ